jgi:hypothetical protein
MSLFLLLVLEEHGFESTTIADILKGKRNVWGNQFNLTMIDCK